MSGVYYCCRIIIKSLLATDNKKVMRQVARASVNHLPSRPKPDRNSYMYESNINDNLCLLRELSAHEAGGDDYTLQRLKPIRYTVWDRLSVHPNHAKCMCHRLWGIYMISIHYIELICIDGCLESYFGYGEEQRIIGLTTLFFCVLSQIQFNDPILPPKLSTQNNLCIALNDHMYTQQQSNGSQSCFMPTMTILLVWEVFLLRLEFFALRVAPPIFFILPAPDFLVPDGMILSLLKSAWLDQFVIADWSGKG